MMAVSPIIPRSTDICNALPGVKQIGQRSGEQRIYHTFLHIHQQTSRLETSNLIPHWKSR